MVYYPKDVYFSSSFDGDGVYDHLPGNDYEDVSTWPDGASGKFPVGRIDNQQRDFRFRQSVEEFEYSTDPYQSWRFIQNNGSYSGQLLERSLPFSFEDDTTGYALAVADYSDPSYPNGAAWNFLKYFGQTAINLNTKRKFNFTLNGNHLFFPQDRFSGSTPNIVYIPSSKSLDFILTPNYRYAYKFDSGYMLSGSIVNGRFRYKNRFPDANFVDDSYDEYGGYSWYGSYDFETYQEYTESGWTLAYYAINRYEEPFEIDLPDTESACKLALGYTISEDSDLIYDDNFEFGFYRIRNNHSKLIEIFFDTSNSSDFSLDFGNFIRTSTFSNKYDPGIELSVQTDCPVLESRITERDLYVTIFGKKTLWQEPYPFEQSVSFQRGVDIENVLLKKNLGSWPVGAVTLQAGTEPWIIVSTALGGEDTEPVLFHDFEFSTGKAETQQLRQKQRDDTPRIRTGPMGGGTPSSGQGSLRRSRSNNFYF